MAAKLLPENSVLSQLLDCDPEAGILIYRTRPIEMFTSPRIWKSWNSHFAGKEAFSSVMNKGYKSGFILGRTYLAHRVLFKMATGQEPQFIDHINGNRADNRISNLRSVTKQENSRNIRIPKNNSSGHLGISKTKDGLRWSVQIGLNKRHIYLGEFKNLGDAVAVRKAAEIDLGFHKNHGRA